MTAGPVAVAVPQRRRLRPALRVVNAQEHARRVAWGHLWGAIVSAEAVKIKTGGK